MRRGSRRAQRKFIVLRWCRFRGFTNMSWNKSMVIAMLNSVYLILREAAGTAFPSLLSTLRKRVSSEEDLIMRASAHVYLGMFGSRPYFSCPDIFCRCIRHGTPSHPGNRLCTDQPHLQVVSAVRAFFLPMVLFPEVQGKSRAELDAVVGSERLPSFNDRDPLPQTNAVWKEVLRWYVPFLRPLISLSTLTKMKKALPHVATEGIYSGGLLIPKGSCIICAVSTVPASLHICICTRLPPTTPH